MSCSPRFPLRALFLAVAFSATAPASAADGTDSSTAMPAMRTQGAITWVSGGIGNDEAMAMRLQESRYPLALEFSQRGESGGELVANVNVTITGPQGSAPVQLVADGPYLLAKLPDGRYKVSATRNGQTKTQDVVVAASKPSKMVFAW